MKNFKMSTEVTANLISNITPFLTKTNKVRFEIGLRDLGNRIACRAVVVNGGQMVEIGFSVPVSAPVEIPETGALLSFNVVANEFVSTLSSLAAFQADIDVTVSAQTVTFKVGQNANIPLSLVSNEALEPVLETKADKTICMLTLAKDFIPTLARGAYLASSAVDPSCITDRAVFIIRDGCCYVYSTAEDTSTVSKAWCTVDTSVFLSQAAVLFLRDKCSHLKDESEKKALMTKMAPFAKDPQGIVELAKKEGFTSVEETVFSLTESTCQTIVKLFSDAEKIRCTVTNNNLCLLYENIVATFALAGQYTSLYKTTIDKWENEEWGAKIVVDKEALLRSLNILKLRDSGKPEISLSYDESGLVNAKCDSVVHTAVSATQGNVQDIHIYLNVIKLITAISKLRAGNIILRVQPDNRKHPISISSGDLTEKVSNYVYLGPISHTEESTASEAEISKKQ